MDANLNYLVPTSGKPIRGLIQDHIVAGVLLTLRDRFMTHDDFVQCVYYGLSPYLDHNTCNAHNNSNNFSSALWQTQVPSLAKLIPIPAILKPTPLWTGKQLISALLVFISGQWRCYENENDDGEAVEANKNENEAATTTTTTTASNSIFTKDSNSGSIKNNAGRPSTSSAQGISLHNNGKKHCH